VKYLAALLAGAFLFSTPVLAQEECEPVTGLVEYLQQQEEGIEAVALNEQQLAAFKARPDLMVQGMPEFDGVTIVHNDVMALIVLTKGECVAGVARNLVRWPALVAVLGIN
jgi:hypothetical protein